MKLAEIKEMPTGELNAKVYELKQKLFELRRKKAVGSLEHGEEVRTCRKDIARCLMVLRDRELNAK